MTVRTRILITACVLCHLLASPRVFTSQLQAEESQSKQVREALGLAKLTQEVTIRAEKQEKAGDVYTLRGDVEVDFQNYVIRGDYVTYNTVTGEVNAVGHLVFDGGPHDEHIEASSGSYNVRTEMGTFYDVVGSTGARVRGSNVLVTSENPFVFRGRRVDKTGPNHYIVHDGSVTTCELPDPKWTFNADRVVVEAGRNAHIYHSSFRLFGVPVVYFPFVRVPVRKLGRESGFLTPQVGQSSRKGTILGESVYWAINRSMDATIGAEYYSHRGWAQHADFRSKPSETSFLNARFFGVLDRGFGSQHVDQGGQEASINSEAQLLWKLRGVADLSYLSSYVFRLAYAETFTQAVNSEVKSIAFLSRAGNGVFMNAIASRYQNFQSTERGDLITILHAPSGEISTVDRRLGNTPLYWSVDSALEGVSRREPDFVTDNLVGRFDVRPSVSVPLLWRGWSFRPELALRNTYYTQRLIPNSGVGVPGQEGVNRRAVEGILEIRPPTLGRIFDKRVAGRTLKHVVEPRLTYRYVNGVQNFANIIRFDARDILSDTNELEYALVQRLYAKGRSQELECPPEFDEERRPVEAQPTPVTTQNSLERTLAQQQDEGCVSGGSRELVRWEVAQKYFFNEDFGGAVINGKRNMLTTTADFTGIAFLTEPQKFSPVISRLRINTTRTTDLEWHLDYDSRKGRINGSTALVNWRLGQFFVGGSHAFLRVPGEVFVSQPVSGVNEFNQFRWLFGYGNPNKRGLSAATNIGFDVGSRFLQYGAFQWTYNWDCCGFSMEYRRFALGSVRNENQFRFAFSLTNIGTFGNLRRQERLF